VAILIGIEISPEPKLLCLHRANVLYAHNYFFLWHCIRSKALATAQE
jgi:hypothetical protein